MRDAFSLGLCIIVDVPLRLELRLQRLVVLVLDGVTSDEQAGMVEASRQ